MSFPPLMSPDDEIDVRWYLLGQSLIAVQKAWNPTTPAGDQLLTPIQPGDSDGTKFAKWQRWAKATLQSIP